MKGHYKLQHPVCEKKLASLGYEEDKMNQGHALETNFSEKRRSPAVSILFVLGVLIAAGGLRIWGVDFGRDLPVEVPLEFSYHQDEPKTLVRAVEMAETGDLNPRWFHYPSLGLYAHAGVQALFGSRASIDPYVASRGFTAFVGLLTVLAVGLLGREWRARTVAGTGMVLLTVSFLHVRSSHFVTMDVPMAFFSTLSAWGAVRFVRRGAWRWLLVSFVCAGAATGVKYNGAPTMLLPLTAVSVTSGVSWGRRLAAFALGPAVSGVSFLATTPFVLFEPETFRAWFDYLHEYQARGQYGFERSNFSENLVYLSGRLAKQGVGWIGAIAALVGIFSWRGGLEGLRVRLPLVVFSSAVLVWLASYRTSFTRNMMPLVPLLAVAAGWGAASVAERVGQRFGGRSALGFGLFFGVVASVAPASDCISYDLTIARSTRTLALDWVDEHLPAGARVATEVYGPPLGVVCPDRYRVLEMWSFGQNLPRVESFEEAEVDFILSNSGAYEMAFSNPGRYPKAEGIYRGIEERYRLVQRFDGDLVDPLYSSISPTLLVFDCRQRHSVTSEPIPGGIRSQGNRRFFGSGGEPGSRRGSPLIFLLSSTMASSS